MTHSVPDHYGSADIVARVLAAVPWSAEDGTPLDPARLFPFDQLHGRELLATRDHAARLVPTAGSHLLDIGSGIGGPARYFATTFGCKVTGVDLTPHFVTAATELTRLSGLADKVDFVLADASDMPFSAAIFDTACCFYVGMNLPDKPAVLNEAFRVLKPGAALVWTQVTAGSGDPLYPQPWSETARSSYLDARDTLAAQVSGAGFEVLSVDDETDAHVNLARRAMAAGLTPSPEKHQANQVVLGPDFMNRRQNYIQSLSDGRIASTVIFARKPEQPL